MEKVVDSTKELGAKVWDSFSYFMNEIGQFIPKLLVHYCFGLLADLSHDYCEN